ncbi:MAG TPA: HepT-like ribonuclease domain-containing protein [Anaerolineales bacterium]|nr:HepT-like ribonuclease domain-containing protein [Anaerolineales bacterium]
MPLDKRELSYLWDMQKAIKEINEFMSGVKFAGFEKNRVLRYAAGRLLLIIGEAANHLSPQFRKRHPSTRIWESLLTRVWLAATDSVPDFLKVLETLLSDEKN